MAEEFDIVVIGGGPAGENVAQYAVQGTSRSAAIVEAELVGGECSYWACMPSKALLTPLDVRDSAAGLAPLHRPALDHAQLLARRDAFVSHYRDERQVAWADSEGLSVVRGRGRLVGERTVLVTNGDSSREIRAREAVVLATGSVPVVPAMLAQVQPWSSRDATGILDVPGSIAIIGGGVVACEAARWLVALGAKVTMIVQGERLLARNEPFAGDLVREGLERLGVTVRLNTQVVGDGVGDGAEAGPAELVIDEVLAATGRRPATDDLGLDTVGVSPRDLDDPARLPGWLRAVGDVTGGPPLTHWGKYQAREVGAELNARATGAPIPPRRDDVPVPQVIFTDPQVAASGITAAEAQAAGRPVQVVDADMSEVAGAVLLRDDLLGHARLVVDSDTHRLLGATFVGPEVAELAHSATVAILAGLTVDDLRHAVPSYPAVSEIWLRLIEKARAKPHPE